MKKGSVIQIEFVGRIKETGQVFDLTSSEIAKKEGIYNPKEKYGPKTILLGGHYIIEGLEEELEKMDIGEEKELVVNPEKAFGKRAYQLIKTLPEKAFRKNKVRPEIGTVVTIGNAIGRIISKGSGRVRVDFNHPLAGKKLLYWIKIDKEIQEDKKKLLCILNYRLGEKAKGIEFNFENKKLKIKLKDIKPQIKEKILSDINLCFPQIEKIDLK